MKKLLLAVLLSMLAAPASAAERVQLPPKMLGTWCLNAAASGESKMIYEFLKIPALLRQPLQA
jgi:hypothetical protein